MSRFEGDLFMRIPSAISICGSSFMIITYASFRVIRQYKYFEILLYVAISDMLASIGLVLGDVSDGSVSCWFQGFLTTYFFLASISWTTVLSYELYLVIVMQEKIQSYQNIHLFCWLFPLLPTFLPLTTNDYGKDDDNSVWCYVSDRSTSPLYSSQVWTITGFYLWIWIAIVVVSYLYFSIQWQLMSSDTLLTNLNVKQLVKDLSYYPLLLILCWLITSIIETLVGFNKTVYDRLLAYHNGVVLDILGVALPGLQGLVHSVIFVWRSRLVREEWKKLFMSVIGRSQSDVNNDASLAPFHAGSSMFGTLSSDLSSVVNNSQSSNRAVSTSLNHISHIRPRSTTSGMSVNALDSGEFS